MKKLHYKEYTRTVHLHNCTSKNHEGRAYNRFADPAVLLRLRLRVQVLSCRLEVRAFEEFREMRCEKSICILISVLDDYFINILM